jgi:hypothetical protein
MKIILLTFFICFFPFYHDAQSLVRQSINTSGQLLVGKELAISQTIGQPSNFSVFNQQKVQLRQGFQQTGQNNLNSVKSYLEFNIFPNPNHGELTVRFSERMNECVQVALYDNLGKLCLTENIPVNGLQMQLSFSVLPGMYFLKIEKSGGISGIEKLIILN